MLQNAYFLAKIGADTAENEQHFAENLPKIGNYPTGVVAVNRVAPRGVAPRVPGRLYRGLHRALLRAVPSAPLRPPSCLLDQGSTCSLLNS